MHSLDLIPPLALVRLVNTQTIDPEVPKAKTSCDLDASAKVFATSDCNTRDGNSFRKSSRVSLLSMAAGPVSQQWLRVRYLGCSSSHRVSHTLTCGMAWTDMLAISSSELGVGSCSHPG
jgi:hypothetical protein